MSEEGLKKTAHSKIFIGAPITISLRELNEKLENLKIAVPCDEETVKKVLSEVVPTYKYAAPKQTIESENKTSVLSAC